MIIVMNNSQFLQQYVTQSVLPIVSCTELFTNPLFSHLHRPSDGKMKTVGPPGDRGNAKI